MSDDFFTRPILNSPYEYPARHWELDADGQPTHRKLESRRPAQFITPIPKPRKRKKGSDQPSLVFDEGRGISKEGQAYDPTPMINELRYEVDKWRVLPQTAWGVSAETARLLQHWRHHRFDSEQLESGDALDRNFRTMAADEIERFRREIVERTGDLRQAENLTDQDLLREVMNTVGKPGRLGEGIRCVVSVAMLTEGWDANTVTHVLACAPSGRSSCASRSSAAHCAASPTT